MTPKLLKSLYRGNELVNQGYGKDTDESVFIKLSETQMEFVEWFMDQPYSDQRDVLIYLLDRQLQLLKMEESISEGYLEGRFISETGQAFDAAVMADELWVAKSIETDLMDELMDEEDVEYLLSDYGIEMAE